MDYEAWIWTELLAFDSTAADLGVGDYLRRLGFTPTGISLLASASDFIMLHEDLAQERVLYPDVCARFGQAGNEERQRQEWTNWQVRDLVARLRAEGVLVYVSVFAAYHHDRCHREWLSDHPEARLVYSHLGVTDGLQMIARLADGTYYHDLFAPQVARVLTDYGFDGFHGPDCLGPGGTLSFNDCSDGMVAQFAEYLGEECPAPLRQQAGWDQPALAARMDFICSHLYDRWVEFNMLRWEQFWAAIVAAVRPLGKGTMINSANTKSAFEGMYVFGMDYRRIAALGVDYLVVETVAANLALINGGHERHFDFAATLAEMKAFAPGLRVIFLHGVKDVCESYDLLRHAPSRLEREVYTLANQYQVGEGGELQRCAAGFMVCLGDGLAAEEWAYLRRQWRGAYSCSPVRAGELTWVCSEAAVDALLRDYPARGTWPAFKQVAHLVERHGLQVQTICRTERLAHARGPLLVPNADLLTAAEREALRTYQAGPVALLERTAGGEMTCRLLERGREASVVRACSDDAWCPERARPLLAFWEPTDYETLAASFWAEASQIIRSAVEAWQRREGLPAVRLEDPEGTLCLLVMQDTRGALQTALVSTQGTYLSPRYRFTTPPVSVHKISGFPYTPLVVSGDSIVSGHNFTPLHVPPYGLIVMDVGLA